MPSFRPALLAGLAATALLAVSPTAMAPAQAQTQLASVSGTGRVIGEREIAKRMADLVQQRNGGRPVEISFHGMDNAIEVPASMSAVLQVESFSYDNRSGRFYASVTTPGRGESIRISGRAQSVEAIPVLKNRVMTGETIARGDIEWLQVPAGRYGGGYVDQIDDLVGQSPRRPLAAGMPIRSADVGRPEAIAKNALVTMVAQNPLMTITTTGRALETGSIGDVVHVMNVQSKKVVQATVIGMNQVRVVTAQHVIAGK